MRAAGSADAASLAALIRLAFADQVVPTDPPPSALRETAESVAALLRAGGGLLEGEPAVGGLIWSVAEGGLYVGRLAVHPQHRRRGVARALLAEADAIARARDLPFIKLSTRLVLTGNRQLFAACGFHEVSEHAHPGYAAPTFVAMEKRLFGQTVFQNSRGSPPCSVT